MSDDIGLNYLDVRQNNAESPLDRASRRREARLAVEGKPVDVEELAV